MSRIPGQPFHTAPASFVFPSRRQPDSGDAIARSTDPDPFEYPHTQNCNYRKVSSLGYHNTDVKQSQERTVQRCCKAFVVVVPPSSLLLEHSRLGHTLSSGPPHRLAQGILLPLFPTIYGQLTAIAKEFNFPSTTGLCLYLHVSDNGISASPRISDDSWPLIWGHVFEPNFVSSLQARTTRSYQFLDTRLARWFSQPTREPASSRQLSGDILSLRKESADVPSSVFSAAPSLYHTHEGSMSHREAESRTSLWGDDPARQPVNSRHRHAPRMLSLVDKVERRGNHWPRRSVTGNATIASPPELLSSLGAPFVMARDASPVLDIEGSATTIRLIDEPHPRTLASSLDHKVRSWRASSIVMDEPTEDVVPESERTPPVVVLEPLDLEEFSWSVSSLGPPTPIHVELDDGYDNESLDLGHRAQGSVALTATTATSWGPVHLPTPPPGIERYPTPDIAHRMIEDSPLTPLTASYGISPSLFSSTVVTASAGHSELDTQSLKSPLEAHIVAVKLSASGFSVTESHFLVNIHAPWYGVWPYFQATMAQLLSDDVKEGHSPSVPWHGVWPYMQVEKLETFTARDIEILVAVKQSSSSEVESNELTVSDEPWSGVWPCFHADVLETVLSGEPWFGVWPYTQVIVETPDVDDLSLTKPWFGMWPYMHFKDVSISVTSKRLSIFCGVSASYPTFSLYPPVYPDIVLYPPQLSVVSAASVQSSESTQPGGILWFGTGPYTKIVQTSLSIPCDPSTGYPVFNLYPPIYPYIVPYPPALTLAVSSSPSPSEDIPITLWSGYPTFNLYPPIYPHIVPYPPTLTLAISSSPSPSEDIPTALWSGYPVFNLYPPIYPHIIPYPPVLTLAVSSPPSPSENIPITLWSGYPTFNLYPPIYPHIVPYPPMLTLALLSSPSPSEGISIAPCSGYPVFNLYIPITLWNGYPVFNLYPSIYPHIVPYPSVLALAVSPSPPFEDHVHPGPAVSSSKRGGVQNNSAVKTSSSSRQMRSYPYFVLYPAVYPDFDLYPVLNAVETSEPVLSTTSALAGPAAANVLPLVDKVNSVGLASIRDAEATISQASSVTPLQVGRHRAPSVLASFSIERPPSLGSSNHSRRPASTTASSLFVSSPLPLSSPSSGCSGHARRSTVTQLPYSMSSPSALPKNLSSPSPSYIPLPLSRGGTPTRIDVPLPSSVSPTDRSRSSTVARSLSKTTVRPHSTINMPTSGPPTPADGVAPADRRSSYAFGWHVMHASSRMPGKNGLEPLVEHPRPPRRTKRDSIVLLRERRGSKDGTLSSSLP
ncbi:hypothetical protein FISHEDRAFT_72558 [Fistulina hepatica ATCC 64428]|nr:hypothetical protein FISHEDRAFT_72558 [Fistulina hepatica ATCC 64428]